MSLGTGRDDLFAMLKAAWDVQSGLAIEDDNPLIIWQGQEPVAPPSADVPYARAVVMHHTRASGSLANVDGVRRYVNDGFVIVQCFGPLSGGKGLTIAEALATVVRDTFEGKTSPGGAWFRNCRAVEVGPTEGWYQVNAIAEFTYDEVR